MKPELQTQMEQSPPGGVLIGAAFESDEIEELGERIAVLRPAQAKELHQYMSLLIEQRQWRGPASYGLT